MRLCMLAAAALVLLPVRSPSGTSAASGSQSICEPDRGPVVWPLGFDGFEPRELYHTHGQFECYEGWLHARAHQGIDIAACEGDRVFAVAPGKVVWVVDIPGYVYNAVYVEGDDGQGIKYQHFSEIAVEVDDLVERDQELGKVTKWDAYAGYEHLHLQIVEPMVTSIPVVSPWQITQDVGNPLPIFAARPDCVPPTIHPLPSGSSPTEVYFSFYEDGGGVEVSAAALVGKSVDVVADVSELFPGRGPLTCSVNACREVRSSKLLAPYRLTLNVLVPVDKTAPREVYDITKTFRIELSGPVLLQEEFAQYLYLPASEGGYEERRMLFLLTNCVETGVGAWTAESGKSYRLELTVEDTSGNATVRFQDIVVP
jgi:hypothetical protein